jgi:hypothetical protein
MNTALEYSTRVVQEGGRRCKKSTFNDLVHLTPLRIPLMNPPIVQKICRGFMTQYLHIVQFKGTHKHEIIFLQMFVPFRPDIVISALTQHTRTRLLIARFFYWGMVPFEGVLLSFSKFCLFLRLGF